MAIQENSATTADADKPPVINKPTSSVIIPSLLAVLVIGVILYFAFSTRSYQWQLSLGGDKYEQAYAVTPLADGGYLTVGVTNSKGAGSNDIWVIKSAANSATEWEKTYGGAQWDIAKSVVEISEQVEGASEKGYLVFGSTSSTDNGDSDFWLLKLDQQGNLLWQKKYGDASEDKGQVILSANDGGYYLLGNSSNESNGFGDALVIKIDSAGKVLWQQTYGGNDIDEITSAQLAPNGDIIFAGHSASNVAGRFDFWLNRITNQGEVIWQTSVGTERTDYSNDVVVNNDGSTLVVGYNNSDVNGLRVLVAVKFDAQGQELWQKEYSAIYNQWSQANAIIATPNGGYVLAGKTKTARQYDDNPHFEPWLIALDENGEKLWDTVHQQPGDHHVNDLQRTEDGGLIVVGSRENQSNRYQSQNTQQKGDNLFIMKMDERGSAE